MKRWIVLGVLLCAASASAQTSIGNFNYYRDVDPIDDTDRSIIATTAIDAALYDNPRLIWRCLDQELELIYDPDEYLGEDQSIPVQFRFDNEPASAVQDWNFSTSGTAAFAPESQTSAFTAAVLDARRVVMRVWDYSDEAYTYTFDLAGIRNALSELACASFIFEEPAAPETIEAEPGEPAPAPSEPIFTRVFKVDLPVVTTYNRIKELLEPGSYTEELNVVHAEGLTIRFGQDSMGTTNLTLSGTNETLREQIRALFF